MRRERYHHHLSAQGVSGRQTPWALIDRGALCLGVEGLASNEDGSSEGASSVSMTGEEVERWGQDTYDCRLDRLRLVYI